MTVFNDARNRFHSELMNRGVYILKNGTMPSNADGSNKVSKAISTHLANSLGVPPGGKGLAAQTTGSVFESLTEEFLKDTFLLLGHLRPGEWSIDRVSQRRGLNLGKYDQYSHLELVKKALKNNSDLRLLFGEDYVVASDVLIARQTIDDASINVNDDLIDDEVATFTSIRKRKGNLPSLHASVSCKWSIRTDRAQNARFEAIQLIRGRKGRVPHLAVVTAEPLPSRLASLALGTGDIDCVYHIALPELRDAVASLGEGEAKSILDLMVDGRRLRDISDLPLDLAI